MDKKIWAYNPDNGALTWVSTGQTIVIIGTDAALNGFGAYAEWFLTSGKQADAAYEKLIKLEQDPVLK